MTRGRAEDCSPLKPHGTPGQANYGLPPISCHAVLETPACAPFIKEKRMVRIKATSLHRKSGQMGHPALVAGLGRRGGSAILIIGRLRLLGVRYQDPALGDLLPDANDSEGLKRPSNLGKLQGIAERHVYAVWLHDHIADGEIS